MTEPLTITTSPRDDRQLDLTIQLGPERTEEALQRGYKHVVKSARVPGFRPGKAPYAAVLRAYGREALLQQIMDDLGQEVYSEALDQEQIEPYATASLVDVTLDPITFKLLVPLEPVIELGDYRAIHIDAPETKVDETEIDTWLEQRRTERAKVEDVDRPAEMGDTLLIDIHGTAGEETIMDNQDWEVSLKAEGGWLPGFDESLVGLAAGDEKTFTLRYPEDSASRFKGQEATFTAKVKKVRNRVLPALDDEFAKGLGEYSDLADLRVKLLERLTDQRKNEAEAKLTDQAMEALVEQATLAYPPLLVTEEAQRMLESMEQRLRSMGYKLDEYLRLRGTTVADYRTQLTPQAEERIESRLALQKFAEQEQLSVTHEEVDLEIEQTVALAGDQADQIRQVLNSENGHAMVQHDLLMRKAMAHLRSLVTGQATAEPVETLPAAQDSVTETTTVEEPAEAEAVATETPVADSGEVASEEEGESRVEAASD